MKKSQVLLAALWMVTVKRNRLLEILKSTKILICLYIQAKKLEMKSMMVHYVILNVLVSLTHLASVVNDHR